MNATVFETRDGSLTLRHPGHGELYHSFEGAKKEAWDLYVEGSGIRGLLEKENVAVLDVGLGLGYTALSTIEAWWQSSSPRDFELLSVEIDAHLVETLKAGTAPWQASFSELWLSWCRMLTQDAAREWQMQLEHPQAPAKLTWKIVIEDLHTLELSAFAPKHGWNFIWQDPFSPKINPTLWTTEWFMKMWKYAATDCVMMTYSVARPVKDNLQSSGWQWQLIPTTTLKKNWLRAVPGPVSG